MFNPIINITGLSAILSKLHGEYLKGILVNKRIVINDSTWIDFVGDFNFSLTGDKDNVTLIVHDVQPTLHFKKLITFQGKIEKLTFLRDSVVISLSGWPDIILKEQR